MKIVCKSFIFDINFLKLLLIKVLNLFQIIYHIIAVYCILSDGKFVILLPDFDKHIQFNILY